MTCNVGGADRWIRLGLAVVFIALNLLGVVSGTLAIVLWVLAVIAGVTGIVRYCPLNSLLGVNTCEKKA